MCIAALLVALMLPEYRSAREPARRNSCVNNIKQIVLALHNYHDVHKVYPPAYTVDAQGKPLHSWRTLILPFLEEGRLYKSIDLSKPWDDPVNAAAARTEVGAYRCPSAEHAANETTYLAFVAPDSCLQPGKFRAIREIVDGASNTLMVIDAPADQAVPWMAPRDADEQLILAIGGNSQLSHPGGVVAGLADGSVRFLPADLPAATRRALISVNGGEKIDFW